MRLARLTCAAAVVLTLAACDNAPARQRTQAPRITAQQEIGASEGAVNLVVWAGYAEDGSTTKSIDWVHPFERKSGCQVTAKVADTSDAMVALMNTGEYDGVSASGDASLRLIYSGVVAPVNADLLRNYADVEPYLRDQPYNSVNGQMYGMPHGYGANYLAYRRDKIKKPASWDVLWKKDSPAAGHVAAYDSPIYIADAALYLKAHRPDLKITDVYELTQQQFDAAADLLKGQRENVNQYWSDYLDEVQSFKAGDTYAGTAWEMTADRAKSEGAPIATTIPSEGTTGWSDTWMVSSRAPHPNCMYKWMNWISSPKVQGAVAQWFGEAPANRKACEYTAKGFCARFHADDVGFYKSLAFWKTPVADCGDARGAVCVDYSKWGELWSQIKG